MSFNPRIIAFVLGAIGGVSRLGTRAVWLGRLDFMLSNVTPTLTVSLTPPILAH